MRRPAEATKARDLLTRALDAGWGGSFQRFTTFDGDPYVAVTIQHPDTGDAFKATWHTRGTGAYRLSDAMRRGQGRNWVDVPLKDITAAITATEATR